MPRSYIHVGWVKNSVATRHAMPNALSQINRFHKDMLLNHETEQQKRETNVTSDQMTSECKTLRRNPPEVRLTTGQKPWRPS